METTEKLFVTKGADQIDDLGWFVQKCRKLVFQTLDKIDNACLEIHEGSHKQVLGNVKADLVGKIYVHDTSLYSDFIRGGSVAAAEAYLAQKWTSDDLTKVIQVLARSQEVRESVERQNSILDKVKSYLQYKVLNFRNANTEKGSKKNILAHYDLGNDLYTRFLDSSMMYSSAIYPSQEATLTEAQQYKLKTICDKLELTSDEHLIEIGTGWGGLAIYAAQHYGCKVTTTTISDEQHAFAQQRIAALGLSKQITLLKKDYRKLEGTFDKLVSIEMIEAVGHQFMAEFFKKCNDLLKPDGKMLIQAITISDQRYHGYRKGVDFIQKYIFPGGCLPSINIMSEHITKQTDMMIDNISDIGLHYARTLNDWREKFDENWLEIKSFGYDDDFKRLWHFYFAYCEGGFLERGISTHHLVARKPLCKEHSSQATLY